ncbi:MAG: FkbM family methyltransferase [Gammaproteobacteria bacterium]|nr:FkbM family methyltransferase [Gammaproteobacteria bacterium]
MAIRAEMISWAWILAAPLRWYIRHFPINRGKGYIVRYLLMPLLPGDGTFVATVDETVRIRLRYRESLGASVLCLGGFEEAELECMMKAARPGDVVCDVGANVGFYTVALAHAVGPRGRVFAFEPLSENVERLEENIKLNGFRNVTVHGCALGERDGIATFCTAEDGAYGGTAVTPRRGVVGRSICTPSTLVHAITETKVPIRKLDSVWNESGRPRIRAIKIDVEGAETSALLGARQVLNASKPLLLVEVDTHAARDRLSAMLTPLGYRLIKPRGFAPWNWVFAA